MSQKVRMYLKHKVMMEADARRSYKKGIDIYERYKSRYVFDHDLQYNLGLLYDHAAIFSEKKMVGKKRYFEKAEKIYTDILKEDGGHRLALNGLCRIYMEYRKDFKKALFYCKKLFTSIKKMKKRDRAVSCVGNVYLYAKKYKLAELWFKKDRELVGSDNLAANVNLLIFYNTIGNGKNAKIIAKKTKEILKEELKKPIYKKIGTNKTIENILLHIKSAESK